jgi:hypothetical protein
MPDWRILGEPEPDTELDRATPGNIRTRLVKGGARVRVSVHRILVALSEAFLAQDIPWIFSAATRC